MTTQQQSSTPARNIYLAGKIQPWGKTQEDWRFALVPGLAQEVSPAWMEEYINPQEEWFVLPQAILGQFNYVGPFFTDLDDVNSGHGGDKAYAHGIDTERWPGKSHMGYPGARRAMVVDLCCKALRRADLVFAWIESPDCYGTLFELGYAKALGKSIAAYCPLAACEETILAHPGHPFAELWFTWHACGVMPSSDPATALQDAISRYGWLWLQERYDSPLESAFAYEWVNQALHLLYPLTPQCPVKDGRYRLDFGYPPAQFGIELDGYTYHSDREAFNRDRQRQREIEAQGWRIMRFAGDELRADIARCVREAAHALSTHIYRQR